MNGHQPLIFVGGIHGVGKTTLSRRVATLLGVEHVTAGDLIRAAAAPADILSGGVGGKAVPDVNANQGRLLRGLRTYRAGRQAAGTQTLGLLLDGHFCLFNLAEQVTEVPFAVFDALQPVAVLLVEADPRTVARRLVVRDGDAVTVETLRALAASECARALSVATRLHVPLYRATGDKEVESSASLAATQLRPHLASEVH